MAIIRKGPGRPVVWGMPKGQSHVQPLSPSGGDGNPSGPIHFSGNDNFADAFVVHDGDVLIGSNVGATKEDGEITPTGAPGGHSVWFRFTALATADYAVVARSSFETVLGVYTGDAVDALTEVASNDDYLVSFNSLIFSAIDNTTYKIAVDGYTGSETGDVLFALARNETGNPLYLDVHSSSLTALDLSANTALIVLDCHDNHLATLGLSANTALSTLDCNTNQLTALDLSANTALVNLDCSVNQIAALDLSANTALRTLNCYGNQIATLDVSTNTSLTTLYCGSNQLTALDLSVNTALTTVACYDNQLTQSAIDEILSTLDAHGLSNGLVALNDNSAPSAIGLAAAASLEARGWTVQVS